MDDKLKVLQEESQSTESTEQEAVTPKSTDTHKMGTTQDCGNFPAPLFPTPLLQSRRRNFVSIDSVILLEDGKSPVIKLRIRDHFSRKIKYAEVSYADLDPKTLKKCVTENGGAPTDWKRLFDALMSEIEEYNHNHIKIMHGHTKLGWSKREDGIAFYHQDVTSSDNQSSMYMGKVDINPAGSLDNIVEMIEKWILSTSEWSHLEAIIAFSVASVVLPFAKHAWGKHMDNLVLHLLGNSTSGKSTSLILHVGLASNPFSEKSGLWLTHQSSLPALIRRIGDNQGFSVAIDELSSASKKEFDDFAYVLGNGKEKDRLKAGGTAFCDSANFSTIILSSGEVSILKKCSANSGIRARCVELRNVPWTDSKEQADAIYGCLRDNYGWVAPLVAKELLDNSDRWKNRWEQIYNQIESQMKEEKILLSIGSIGSRISEYVVLFTLAAEIAKKVLNISLHVDKIRDFCYRHVIVANADEANLVERAYEYLLRYVSEHPDEFADDDRCETYFDAYYSKTVIKGFYRQPRSPKTINGKEYRRQIVFLENAFKKLLEDGGFSPTVVSHELHNAEFLQTKDHDRHTYRLTYNKFEQNCYVLYCNDDDETAYDKWADRMRNLNAEDDHEE